MLGFRPHSFRTRPSRLKKSFLDPLPHHRLGSALTLPTSLSRGNAGWSPQRSGRVACLRSLLRDTPVVPRSALRSAPSTTLAKSMPHYSRLGGPSRRMRLPALGRIVKRSKPDSVLPEYESNRSWRLMSTFHSMGSLSCYGYDEKKKAFRPRHALRSTGTPA